MKDGVIPLLLFIVQSYRGLSNSQIDKSGVIKDKISVISYSFNAVFYIFF